MVRARDTAAAVEIWEAGRKPMKALLGMTSAKGVSSLLTCQPLRRHGFTQHITAFLDGLCIRYGLYLLCSVFLHFTWQKYRCKKKAHSVNQTWYDTVHCERTVNKSKRGSQTRKSTSKTNINVVYAVHNE